MNKMQLLTAIIQKQDELLDLYASYAKIEEDDNWKDRYKDAELCREITSLRQQLEKYKKRK